MEPVQQPVRNSLNRSTYSVKGKTELSRNQFSSEVCRKELCIMILMHECPLSTVDNLYFKQFCCTVQPFFKIPTRNTVKKDILNLINDGDMIINDEAITAESLELVD
ncbi:hypothetical protein LINGRAHAP2_LOCUS4991 [Linum grandiflorum]